MSNEKPGKPYAVEQTSSTVKLRWDVLNSTNIEHFDVKYNCKGEKKWKSVDTEDNASEILVAGLKSNSTYVFKVRTVFEDGDESPFSDASEEVETLSSLAEKIKENSVKIETEEYANLYKVPIINQEIQNDDLRVRKCTVFTDKKDRTKLEKTVMVVGQTGVGKSTLIDAMVNYILNVAWEETDRFKLIDLTDCEIAERQDQRHSQTEWITCYSLHWMPGCLIDYHFNIIDTPGFGDTRGIERDKKLVQHVRALFSSPGQQGIDKLDAVWFVTQAHLCRLSVTQRYIFYSILSMFGKDIESNIFVLITFADSKRPPALEALKEANVPFEKEFIFNNSALYVDPTGNKTGQIFWEMGKKSFEEFFKVLAKSEAKSLVLTKEVLKTRRELEEKISIIQKQITEGMQKLSIMREEEEELEKNQRLIADNQDFSYEVLEEQAVHHDLPVGQYTNTCLKCNRTCHENCTIPDVGNKAGCVAMKGGFCTVCPQKCIWSEHRHLPYIILQEKKKVVKTYEQTKAKYMSAQKDKDKIVSVIDAIKREYNSLMEENKVLVTEVKQLLNRLQEIALKPNPISEIEYIDILIENEKEEKKWGYKERVKILEELRQKAENIRDIGEDKFSFPKKITINVSSKA